MVKLSGRIKSQREAEGGRLGKGDRETRSHLVLVERGGLGREADDWKEFSKRSVRYFQPLTWY